MNISYNWLKEYVDFDMTPEEVSAALTSMGLETDGVEEVQTIKGGLEGLVIGEVLTCVDHPDSDHLHITTVNLDEYRGLPRDNDQSYYYFMNDNLFNHVNIDKARTHVPNGMVEDAEVECGNYEALIKEVGGVDLQLLGLGHNGHIGFNEPSEEFDKVTHCVDLQESTIEANKRFFASIDDVPRQAYTMGIGTIMAAKKILVVVSGKDKAEIVKKAFTGPVTPHVPASILQMHPDVTVVCDAEAYGEL